MASTDETLDTVFIEALPTGLHISSSADFMSRKPIYDGYHEDYDKYDSISWVEEKKRISKEAMEYYSQKTVSAKKTTLYFILALPFTPANFGSLIKQLKNVAHIWKNGDLEVVHIGAHMNNGQPMELLSQFLTGLLQTAPAVFRAKNIIFTHWDSYATYANLNYSSCSALYESNRVEFKEQGFWQPGGKAQNVLDFIHNMLPNRHARSQPLNVAMTIEEVNSYTQYDGRPIIPINEFLDDICQRFVGSTQRCPFSLSITIGKYEPEFTIKNYRKINKPTGEFLELKSARYSKPMDKKAMGGEVVYEMKRDTI